MKILYIVLITLVTIVIINSNILYGAEFNLNSDSQQNKIEVVGKTKARIKDVVKFDGIRDNILIGFGLVIGLNGTGDNLRNSAFTQQGIEGFLGKLGINLKGANFTTKNIAAVTVTATLPPFLRPGNRIDISVSTLGDATNISGGILIATPLFGADSNIYAIAQGPISVNDFENRRGSVNKGKGIRTTGFITSGAIIEKEIDFSLDKMSSIKLSLFNSDISTAKNVAEQINTKMHDNIATAKDPSTIEVVIPSVYKNNTLGLLADIEQLEIYMDNSAKIVIDESSGTVIIGEDVKINTVAIAQGNLMINIDNQIATLEQNNTIKDLITGLNVLGVSPRDLIGILQNMKVAGALHADIIIR